MCPFDVWNLFIQLFQGGNYSRAETIRGNTVLGISENQGIAFPKIQISCIKFHIFWEGQKNMTNLQTFMNFFELMSKIVWSFVPRVIFERIWYSEFILEIFYQDYCKKALVLAPATVLEIFWQDFWRKAQVLVNPTVLEIF